MGLPRAKLTQGQQQAGLWVGHTETPVTHPQSEVSSRKPEAEKPRDIGAPGVGTVSVVAQATAEVRAAG